MRKGSKNNKRHGMRYERVYRQWADMLNRCRNKNVPGFKNYGGRGIMVCKEWEFFVNFYRDMGPCPARFTLERINNNAGYFKKNCRWATMIEQGGNRRNNILIEFNDEKKCLAAWARDVGVSANCIKKRMRNGWPVDKVLSKKKFRAFEFKKNHT